MSRLLTIHETAEAEINEAANFYDLKSPGLGNVFIDEIQRTIDNIAEFPEASPLVRGRVRKKILIKFPYALLYSVRQDEIRILAVAHQKRRPFYWHGRVKDTKNFSEGSRVRFEPADRHGRALPGPG